MPQAPEGDAPFPQAPGGQAPDVPPAQVEGTLQSPYGSAPSPYNQPNPYVPQPPTAPSHLGPGGALQSFGVVPGSRPRSGANPYGRQQPYKPQPHGPASGLAHQPSSPPAPGRSQPGVIIGVAALLVLSLVIVVAFAGGYVQKLFASPDATTSPTPSAGTTPTASPSATSTSGVVISKPPVPAPTATTQRSWNSPDRPKVAIPNVKPAGFINPPAARWARWP